MDRQRVALVTGASRGIGREIARQLSEDHGLLVLAGERAPGSPFQLDVADPASVAAAAERVRADPGRLDVLVNNAGIGGPSEGVGGADLDAARAVLETNLWGAWRMTQAFLPLLRESPDARVVNISSGMGQLSDMGGGYAAYRISKTGLNALTRVTAADEPSVKANVICPGWVRTDMGGSSATRSVEEGADTAVWLATADGIGSGGFYRSREPISW